MTNRKESTSRQLSCRRCGIGFTCDLSGECWCAAEPYRMPMPAHDGGDCLCPDCLRALASQQTDTAAT
ncbi:hypothetical protein AAFX91_40385 [Bradyrhizobium sp. 31Argb]|uniref:hypothetical protein n=1 Tax=unclassified Bradyrhizobium TaxID=2631580 RepID=UPI00102E597D|nr:hypothetical protein [Bradyrhizobium sp. Leo170]TAI61072.1 hypothetical protein CWO89_37235 [Bradyrhizobium sp. Leo170]